MKELIIARITDLENFLWDTIAKKEHDIETIWNSPFFVILQCGFPGDSDGKEFAYNAEDKGWDSIPGSGRFPGEENGPTPVFLHGEFHKQRSLVGYNPWGHKELDRAEWLSMDTHIFVKQLYKSSTRI